MKKSIVVIARVKAKSGKKEELKKELLKLIEPSRKDDGCINYDLHNSEDEPGQFMFHETWRDKEALTKHLATPHLRKFIEISDNLIEGQINISLWNKIEE
jgi:quinol monooxygenase YgiN